MSTSCLSVCRNRKEKEKKKKNGEGVQQRRKRERERERERAKVNKVGKVQQRWKIVTRQAENKRIWLLHHVND